LARRIYSAATLDKGSQLKYLSLLAITIFISSQAFANLECAVKTSAFSAKIITNEPADGNQTTLTIQLNGTTIYSAVSVVSDDRSGGRIYQSPTFNNANHVPSALVLRIYMYNGTLTANFYESSYLPVVPSFSTACTHITVSPQLYQLKDSGSLAIQGLGTIGRNVSTGPGQCPAGTEYTCTSSAPPHGTVCWCKPL
jgi:hypothetical protein